MKLTDQEISTITGDVIHEIAMAYKDPSKLPPAAREFSNQLVDNENVGRHIIAVMMMEKYAQSMDYPPDAARMAAFVGAAWIGFKLKEAEIAKAEVADLDRMAAK